jgi:hypothetical protein
VDFCQVLTSAPEYQGRTFRTEIIVVPDYHGRYATISQCKIRAIRGRVAFAAILFAKGSFDGSPAVRKLDDEVERAYRTTEDAIHPKAVAVRVTARVEKSWFDRWPGVFSPHQGYVLRLLDADGGRIIDLPEDVLTPTIGE